MAIRGIEAIFADLLQEDPPRTGTNVLATEVLALSPDEAADYLFRAMRDRPSEVAHGAIVLLLAELAGRDDRWQRLVSKSLTKAGRCPRGLRAQLRQALLGSPHDRGGPRPVPLTDETTEEKHRQTPPPADVKRTGRHLKLTIDTASTNIQHLGTLVNALARADRELSGVKVCELDLRSVDHLYIGGLVVLAAWCGRRGIRPQLKNVSAGTRDYLNKVGFDRWVDGSFATGLIQDIQGWGVAVSSLGSRDPEELAGELTEICVKHGWIGQRDRNALVILFSELTENVRRHGGAGAAATVGAQFYPGRRKLNIALADTGIGIRASFVQGRNPEAIRRLGKGESPLRLAVAPRVTSKPVRSADEPGHAGYGLYVASELAVRNGGTFRLTSGSQSLLRYRVYKGDHGTWSRHTTEETHQVWNGTIVSLVLDLENLLPISEVYATLPLPDGYAAEDFFD